MNSNMLPRSPLYDVSNRDVRSSVEPSQFGKRFRVIDKIGAELQDLCLGKLRQWMSALLDTIKRVLGFITKLQMIRVAAFLACEAGMENELPFRNISTMRQNPSYFVRAFYHLAMAEPQPDLSVAILAFHAPGPRPTLIFCTALHLAPKTIRKSVIGKVAQQCARNRFRIHKSHYV